MPYPEAVNTKELKVGLIYHWYRDTNQDPFILKFVGYGESPLFEQLNRFEELEKIDSDFGEVTPLWDGVILHRPNDVNFEVDARMICDVKLKLTLSPEEAHEALTDPHKSLRQNRMNIPLFEKLERAILDERIEVLAFEQLKFKSLE